MKIIILLITLISFSINILAAQYNESPSLSKLVKQNKIPTINQRLPDNPMVITPFDTIGSYGGILHRALKGPFDQNGWRTITGDALFEWDFGQAKPILSLAEEYHVENNNKVHVVKLRKGLRWSDGKPFTADDLMFFHDAVIKNDELQSMLRNQGWAKVAGNKTKLVKKDSRTVEFHFKTPYALFNQHMAYYGDEMLMPKHYMKQFHVNYTSSSNLDSLIKKSGVKNWAQLFIQKYSVFLNPDLPVMNAWKVNQAFPAKQMTTTRNPFYWKVDNEGNQLPYIDSIVVDLIEDGPAISLRAANGGIDFQYRHIRFSDLAILKDGENKGKGYTVNKWSDTTGWFSLYTNQSHKDPVMRKLMQDINFRAGLSHAIDREEMNEIMYLGTGEVSHPAGLKGDPYFIDGFGQKFINHDVNKANNYLNKAGLTKKDSNGMRLRPDGKPLTLTISTYPFETGHSSVDGYEMVAGYWEKVGINTVVDLKERSLWTSYVRDNNHDIAGYLTASVLWNINPTWYVPTSNGCYWAPAFGKYYATGGKQGMKPNAINQKIQNLFNKLIVTLDENKNLELGQEILRIHSENVFMIGTVKTPFQPVIINNKLRNVVKNGVADFRYRHEGQSKFYQLSY